MHSEKHFFIDLIWNTHLQIISVDTGCLPYSAICYLSILFYNPLVSFTNSPVFLKEKKISVTGSIIFPFKNQTPDINITSFSLLTVVNFAFIL